jgi:anti-sigma factor RsiW
MNITRDIVSDLWPLYQSGEASADTRALVEAFLAEDREFARMLREDTTAALLAPAPVTLEPDHELKALARTKRDLLRKEWPLFCAMLFSCMAFGRIVSDTSFDVSPRAFIATASIAVVFWIVFLVHLARRLAIRR